MRYHEMNRKDREMDEEGVKDILRKGRYIVLALSNGSKPYTVTLSYGYDEGRNCLFFHSALKGLKLDIIRENPDCCGTIIEDHGYCHGDCSHKYRSAVLFGRMGEVLDLDEKKRGMTVMFDHLEDDAEGLRKRFLEDDEAYSRLMVLRMEIDSMRGKESL